MLGFELAVGIIGLTSFTSRMIELLTGLSSSLPKSTQLLTSLRNLRHVLEHVHSDYSLTLKVLPRAGSNITTSLLRACIGDIEQTCKEYDELLQNIRRKIGGFRQVKWKTSASDRMELDRRLEASKSTLLLLLYSITYDQILALQPW